MSTGLFLGVRGSYIDEAQDSAVLFLEALNRVLGKYGYPAYRDPITAPDIYVGNKFGRSALDHHSSRVFAQIASFVDRTTHPNLALIHDNPYRVTFVPADLSRPFPSGFTEQIARELVEIWIGSLRGLLGDLIALAEILGIEMKDGALSDDIARAINDFERLRRGDSQEVVEDYRTAWLALFEGARLALQHNLALTLAG